MSENEWTNSISDLLSIELKKNSLLCKTLVKLPYSQEILKYEDDFNWAPSKEESTRFETDLVIYEKDGDGIKPRVIVEAKLDRVTTHDAITYSYKAEKHKNITPYLRYGIMIGNREHYPLPGRLYRHGTHFDFMFSFSGLKPTEEEWKTFVEMINREVEYSRLFEEMLHESRNPNRKHYYMLEKQLVLKEFNCKK